MWQSPWTIDSKILVEPEPVEAIAQYRQDHNSKAEAGGILLGYRREAHLHVTVATVPQPSDQRRRFWFSRSYKYHQQVALQHWEASVGEMDYLGEWHTHPEGSPMPSSLDLSEWRKIYFGRTNPMIFVILGWSGELWVGMSGEGCVKRCIQISE
jgi:integrative and conjugative element protein (TIGR02256 family)